MTKKLFTFTGPSCSGKTTLIRKLLDTSEFCEIVSFTTRQPRHGEVHGVDYNFVPKEIAETWVNLGETAEHILFKDQIYGIHRSEINGKVNGNQTPLVIVEPHGLQQLRNKFKVYSIYIDSPIEVLYSRFLSRFKENPNANVDYEAKRVTSIYMEWESWPEMVKADLYFPSFDKDNEGFVMNRILEAAKKSNG